jgi:uncharacterized ferredoxin-like protein
VRALLEALRAELRPIDIAVALGVAAWAVELVLGVHDRVVWRDGYAAGVAGAQLRERIEEPA